MANNNNKYTKKNEREEDGDMDRSRKLSLYFRPPHLLQMLVQFACHLPPPLSVGEVLLATIPAAVKLIW
jgi:hypothetical protein